jgi:hypothetical protein
MLGLTATQCASYLRFAREVRALRNVDADAMKNLENALEETHRLARKCLAEFSMIPHDRVALAALNAEGLDADIVDICAPFDPIP